MKTIINYKFFLLILFSTSLLSCVSDLDTEPVDGSMLVAEQVYKQPGAYKGVLAKCYASLALTGQTGPSGDADIVGIDEAYSSYIRSFFYLQVVSTDESLSVSTSNGMRDMVTMNWTPSTAILSGAYNRVYQAIGFCNEFLRQSTMEKLSDRGQSGDSKLVAEVEMYRNEVRLIRAYTYWAIIDAFGAAPFISEEDPVGGKFLPPQKSRIELFNYVESELKDLESKLAEPKTNEYGRVDKVAVWHLLSRLYLNAEVYTGTARFDDCLKYSENVIQSGYSLAPKFIYNFLADNNTSPEIIWGLTFDGTRGKTYGGTTFHVLCQVGGTMLDYLDFGINSGWANIRLRPELPNKFSESDQLFDINDIEGNNKKDKRSLFYTNGHTKEVTGFSSNFQSGYASTKWRNVTKTGEGGSDKAYVDNDFPLFRLADAYLMAAEAALRIGGAQNREKALAYINELRDRAYESGKYGNAESGRITDSELNLDFILDERSREMAWELTRRTDLIRFGQYTNGTYHWAWKGNVIEGQAVDRKYNLFPIPEADVTANPNIVQNSDFK